MQSCRSSLGSQGPRRAEQASRDAAPTNHTIYPPDAGDMSLRLEYLSDV